MANTGTSYTDAEAREEMWPAYREPWAWGSVYAATDPPKVTATYPAAGQALSAGVLVLTVTFDQQMEPGGFSITPTAGGEALQCLKTPRLLSNGKTFALLCTAQEKKRYALAFNAQPKGGFANLADQRATPSTLEFSTTDADGPRNIADAMKIEKLTNVLHMGRPGFGQAESSVGIFVVDKNKGEAHRVTVQLGRASVNTIEIKQGLQVGSGARMAAGHNCEKIWSG